MKKLLNTLFVTSEDAYLTLDGENVVVNREKQVTARFPLHALAGIISFSYAGASPTLMGACAKRDVSLSFCTPRGRFLARTCGVSNGNVLLRRTQYRTADDPPQACRIARMMVFGKIYNARWSIERTCRDHAMRVDTETLKAASAKLKALLPQVQAETDSGSLRGLEGASAAIYFDVFDQLILNHKDVFSFTRRSRRPPLDPWQRTAVVRLFPASERLRRCAGSRRVGQLYRFSAHRPSGRQSLAADLMEELRPCFADRFVLSAVNLGRFSAKDFEVQENGAVYLSENARKTFLQGWQEKKREEIRHPYLEEKLSWGMVPYAQALLLARYLRGDTDDYPPFLWK